MSNQVSAARLHQQDCTDGKCSLIDSAFTGKKTSDNRDGVYNYACVLCHYGSLVMEFRDAWAEGDGERVLQSYFCLTSEQLGVQSMLWRHCGYRCKLMLHCPPTLLIRSHGTGS